MFLDPEATHENLNKPKKTLKWPKQNTQQCKNSSKCSNKKSQCLNQFRNNFGIQNDAQKCSKNDAKIDHSIFDKFIKKNYLDPNLIQAKASFETQNGPAFLHKFHFFQKKTKWTQEDKQKLQRDKQMPLKNIKKP